MARERRKYTWEREEGRDIEIYYPDRSIGDLFKTRPALEIIRELDEEVTTLIEENIKLKQMIKN